jgi:hypothetical protein
MRTHKPTADAVYFNHKTMVLYASLSKRMYLKSELLFKEFNHMRAQWDKTEGMVQFCREAAQQRNFPTAKLCSVTSSTIPTGIFFYSIHKGFNKGK